MTLKRNKTDIFILIISILFVVAIVLVSNFTISKINGANKYVVISIDGRDKYKYSLDNNRTIELKASDYPTLLGDMTIEIKDKRVRVSKEKSPKNYCSKQGWVGSVGTPIVCLPNAVVVTIIGSDSVELDWQV